MTRGGRLALRGFFLALCGAWLGAGSPAAAADAKAAPPRELSVEKTFDNAPFRYRMQLTAQRKGYRIYRLSYPSPVTTPVKQNNTVPADYYLPEGIEPGSAKRPAVICIHILNGNYELVRMLCSALATRGIPAVMFKLPYYGERSLPGGRGALARNPKLFVEALPQGIQDARRTLDVLASRPEVDPRRIGISGISLGGIVAATAAGADPRINRAALILSGGDLLQVIHHCREARELSEFIKKLPAEDRAEIEKAVGEVDPLRHAAGLKDRAAAGKVLMVNATGDNVIPRACTEKLAAALGISERVVWLEGLGHYTAILALPQTLRRTVDFFALDMPPGVKGPEEAAAASRQPLQVVAGLVTQAASFLTVEPAKGRCHLVDVEATVTDKAGKTYEGRIRFIRGWGHRFALQLEVPVVGKASLGQGAHPWIASAKTVYCGVKGAGGGSQDPLAHADSKYVAKVRMLAGGVAAVSLAPSILEQAIEAREDRQGDGPPAIRITPKGKKRDSVRLVLQRDGKTPQSATFDVDGVKGKVTFREWQANTVAQDALFEPPAGLARRDVDRADIHRVFSAMFNFAMELTE